MQGVVRTLAQLALAHDSAIRDLEATNYRTFMMDIGSAAVKEGKEAGKAYGAQCRGKKPAEHKMGPPAPHIIEGFLRGPATDCHSQELKTKLGSLHAGLSGEENRVLYKLCKIKDCYDRKNVRVVLAVPAEAAAVLALAITNSGGTELQGSAPPGGLAGELSNWLE